MASFPFLPGFAPTQDIDRHDFKRVSALKLEKNATNPTDFGMKYRIPQEKLKPIPITATKEHPDFVSTTKATYKGYGFESRGVDVDGLNRELFQPDYAHNDNSVTFFSDLRYSDSTDTTRRVCQRARWRTSE